MRTWDFSGAGASIDIHYIRVAAMQLLKALDR